MLDRLWQYPGQLRVCCNIARRVVSQVRSRSNVMRVGGVRYSDKYIRFSAVLICAASYNC